MNHPVEDCLLAENKTLLDAMRILDHSRAGIALLVDRERRLLGTLTDGDIRRAILNGANVESSAADYSRKQFTVVEEFRSRADVLDLMQSLFIHQIPIVDKAGRVTGLHLLHEIIGAPSRPNWAVIMAGGRGTRLGKLTEATPKPMLRVAGRPILERLVWHLAGFGIRRIFISVNYLGSVIEEYFGDGSRLGGTIDSLREEEPLGTAGSLSLLPETPNEPLIVCNGDIITQADLGGLLHFHASGKYKATIGTRTHTYQVPFGCIQTENGRVTQIEEKPVMAHLISSGIYVLEPSLLKYVPKAFYPITSLFEDCIKNNEPVSAFEISEDWIDVGQAEQLRQARGE